MHCKCLWAAFVFAVLVSTSQISRDQLSFVTVKNLNDSSWPPSSLRLWLREMTVNRTLTWATTSSSRAREGDGSGLSVRSNRLPEGPNTLVSDVDSGMVKLICSGVVRGRLTLWKRLNWSLAGKMDCTMTLVLKSKTVEALVCRK
ncbi:hypothetical protein M0R45_014734 [Rubus argutus]|uniref:Uncharacterized protein n=1 Tax=Rubus argutus TaxID=59490 RepID=A0AAW1XNE2_RUBAR